MTILNQVQHVEVEVETWELGFIMLLGGGISFFVRCGGPHPVFDVLRTSYLV